MIGKPRVARWAVVLLLATVGLIASVARSVGTIDSVRVDPRPELSQLDERNTESLARIIHVEPGTAEYREAVDQNRRFLRKFNAHPAATLFHVLAAAMFMILAPLQ